MLWIDGKIAIALAVGFSIVGCMPNYFPTFSTITPGGQHLSSIPIAQVAKQVKCEVQRFLTREAKTRKDREKYCAEQLRFSTCPFLIDEALPLQVDLQLKTDELGAATFSAIDYKKMGFDSLAHFISAKNPPKDLTPFLSAGVQVKGTRTVTMSFLIPQLPPNDTKECIRESIGDANKLYIEEWLSEFMERTKDVKVEASKLKKVLKAATPKTDARYGNSVPDILLNQVALSTDFHIIVDVTAGINVFNNTGPGTGFYMIPVQSPPTLQVRPDYSHQITITLKGAGSSALKDTDVPNKKRTTQGVLNERNYKLLLDQKLFILPSQ